MSIGVQAFRGRRLTEARLARGLFKNALADLVGVSGTAIARYEDGTDKPHHERIEALADKLSFPYDFFLRPEWPGRIDYIFWRSQAAETKSARSMTEQRMIWLVELFSFLERELDFPPLDLPELSLPKDVRLITPNVIETAAEDLRSYWQMSDFPIPDVTLAIENAGIPVVNLEIPSDKQDGFFFGDSLSRRLFVGINTYNVSCARARYDCAHELGHAILHRYVTPAQSKDTSLIKVLEPQAHRFAGAFLFPRASFRREVGTPSLDYFCNLKKRWGISIAAMIYRAFDLGLIDDGERADLYRKMTKRRWRGPLQEPFDDRISMPLEIPRMMRRGVETLLSERIFGASQIKSELALPDKELEQLLTVHPGFFADAVRSPSNLQIGRPLDAQDLESGKIIAFSRKR